MQLFITMSDLQYLPCRDENEVIPKVVEAILNMSEQTHIAVRYTAILLIGELCDWIENHPESLEAVLNFCCTPCSRKMAWRQLRPLH